MNEPSDAELMALVQREDRDAFAAIVERHKHALVGYLSRLTGSRDRAEDLAQDAFVRLYESRGKYREEGKLAPYLFRIATNLARSEARRARRWRTVGVLLGIDGRKSALAPEAQLLRSEAHRRVAEAVAELPTEFRAAVLLKDALDWSYDDIARALDKPEGTIKSRVARGRERLRRRLAGAEGGADA